MKKQTILFLLNVLLLNGLAIGQNVVLEGYVFEDNNRGFLNEVEIRIYDGATEAFIMQTMSNFDGLFTAEVPTGKTYILKIKKDLFFDKEESISTKGKTGGEKVYAKIKLERKPGYIFDVTLAESGAPTATVDAITGARIEVFNNTKMEETLVIDALDGINFDVTFERGNHYTVLIRKKGYFNKRLEAYVDVEGCILCFEGVGNVTPGVSDVMSEGFQMGSVLANIELEPATLNRTIKIENIYYDLDKYAIREDAAVELDKVVKLLNDNPSIIIELGSHTDSRGGTRYNKQLSTNRAKAAVEYIMDKGEISKNRISYKGYGESQLVNKCTDGVKCSEKEHQQNRRTELKIVGFEKIDPLQNRTLAEMITEEKLLREVLNSEQIQVKPGEVPNFDKLEKPKGTKTNTKPTTKSTASPKPKNTKVSLPTATSATKNDTKSTPSKPMIISKSGAETLVGGGNATTTTSTTGNKRNLNSSDLLNFNENKVLIVRGKQAVFLEKMIGNQLNQQITDLLIGEKIYLQKARGIIAYKFDTIDQMPVELLNVFLGKLALLEKGDGWQVFPIEKGSKLPKVLLTALE